MAALSVALTLLSAVSLFAVEPALVRVGDVWRYTPGFAAPSQPTELWRYPDFDDSRWAAAPSGFSSGYDVSEATALPDNPAQPYLSAYFRRSFVLTNRTEVKWLTLRIDYADGFVAYLNGREVARRNVRGAPGTTVGFDERASDVHARSDPDELDLTAFSGELITGTNTFAVQVHSGRMNNIGLAFSAELAANFTRAPLLQRMSSNRVDVLWNTPLPADTRVEFGTFPELTSLLLDTNLVTSHVAVLTNLTPDTPYSYRASSSAGGTPVGAPVAQFHTFKTAGPVTFIALGDSGWNSVPQYQLAKVMRSRNPDFVIETGDIVYPEFTSTLVDLRCFSVYGPHMASAPYFFSLGNHDAYDGGASYVSTFDLPTNNVPLADHVVAGTTPEHYYSFDHGDVHVVVLYIPYLSQYQLREGDPQYRWLTNDLASSPQPWKVAVWHVPMNSSSAHSADDTNGDGLLDRFQIRDVLLPVLSRYGVQLGLCGHEHGYERFNPTNGVHMITTASGGIPVYGFTTLDPASALFWPRVNCVQVTVTGDTLRAEAIGNEGDVFDGIVIQRRALPPLIYDAAWHTPLLPTAPANDGDGNVQVQFFDFVGQPVPAVAGQFSNLGELFVNNDATNLYVGLKHVMIYSDNTVFLLLESPRVPGVTSLAGLGNGRVDPAGQGVDGLDFLQNLSFTNFTPRIGCLLGDEFADGQFRSFTRPGLAFNTGQGIYHLDATFSDVQGSRLQQFHVSPQLFGAGGEQNAGYIEIAVPLAELGNPSPGDIVKIGAVVGGANVDLLARSRSLDTGFLGPDFNSNGVGPAVIEGFSFRLAQDPQSTNSALTLDFELRPDQQLRLTWKAVPDATYQVEGTDPQWSNFVPVATLSGTDAGAAGRLSYYINLAQAPLPASFYRVRVTFPPP